MGIYDRQWYRESSPGRMPSMNPVTKWLLILNGVAFLLTQVSIRYFRWDPASGGLALVPDDVIGKFYLWQLVTSLFLHASLLHLGFNMLVLWMFGSHVERSLGPSRFLRFYLYAGVAASLAYAVIGQITAPYERAYAVGASGAIMGIMVWFAVKNPNALILLFFFVPMKMKHAMFVIVAMDLYGFVFAGPTTDVAHTAHLGGALFGFLYARYADRIGWYFAGLEKKAAKSSSRRDADRDQATQDRVDRLLEKIHDGGIDALTTAERDFLRDASKRYRKGGP